MFEGTGQPATDDSDSLGPPSSTQNFSSRFQEPASLGPGTLGVYALMGGLAGGVPLPWLPDSMVRGIRGAMVQDIAHRAGVHLPHDARDVLSEPTGTEGPRSPMGHAAKFAVTKVLARLGPAVLVPPLKACLETFVLGHLFHRYVDQEMRRTDRRLDVVEARRIRRAIDRALVSAITISAPRPSKPSRDLSDDRDSWTILADNLVMGAAGVPSWVAQRLEAAFDEQLRNSKD